MLQFRVKKDSIIPTPSGSSKKVNQGDLLEGDYYLPMVSTGILEQLDDSAQPVVVSRPQAVAVPNSPSADTSRCAKEAVEKVAHKRTDLEQMTKADLLKLLPLEAMSVFKGDKNDLINQILKG